VNHPTDRLEAAHLNAQTQRRTHLLRRLLQQRVQRGVLLQADEVEAGGITQGDFCTFSQHMLAWRDQHQPILAVGKHLQVLGRHVPGEDADIGQPLAQGAQGVTADALLQVDLHLRVLAGEGTQVLGEKLDHRRGIGVDAHMALHALAELAQVGVQLLQVVQQVARVVQQRVTGRRQLDALGLAIEQADAELPFQIADALAHRRQGQMFTLGGTGQAALVGDGDEQA